MKIIKKEIKNFDKQNLRINKLMLNNIIFKNHNMALYRPHLKAVSDSAPLKEVSKLSQKLELKLTDDQWPQRHLALDL